MRNATTDKNHLPQNAYTMPGVWSGTLTAKELRETLLATDGWVFACGLSYDIKSERVGAGVYRVWLKSRR